MVGGSHHHTIMSNLGVPRYNYIIKVFSKSTYSTRSLIRKLRTLKCSTTHTTSYLETSPLHIIRIVFMPFSNSLMVSSCVRQLHNQPVICLRFSTTYPILHDSQNETSSPLNICNILQLQMESLTT